MDNVREVYINGTGIVAPRSFDQAGAGAGETIAMPVRVLRCADPGYREYIPADQIRRMGRIIKMGITAAKRCLADAAMGKDLPMPEAIITGTGLGCVEDTEKFLASMIRNKEEFLTPTSFIQSTHNTVAGQIALQLKCHAYNFTYVHRGISFESALTDAMVQIQTGQAGSVLLGGCDELTENTFLIMERLGMWKRKAVIPDQLPEDSQRGTIAGEGAAFFYLSRQKEALSYARIDDVLTFTTVTNSPDYYLKQLLERNQLASSAIGLVVAGLNGDPRYDHYYTGLMKHSLPGCRLAWFKHLCGEYHTASSYAMALAAHILKHDAIPAGVLRTSSPGSPDRVLIYNHFNGENHAFILLSRP